MIKRNETCIRCQKDTDFQDGEIIVRGGLRRFLCTSCVTKTGVNKQQGSTIGTGKDHKE